jgi:hypothetical protein
MTLTPPAVATSIASALGIGIFAPAGLALAVALFGVGAMLKHAEAEAKLRQNRWSYVIDVTRRTD